MTEESAVTASPPFRHEAFYRAFVKTALDVVLVSNARGIVVDATSNLFTLLGYTPDEVVGRNVSMLMAEPDRRNHDSYMKRYEVQRVPRVIGTGRDVTGMHKSGQLVPLHLSVTHVNGDGPPHFVGILRDLTSLERVTQEGSHRRFLAAILDALPSEAVVIDDAAKIVATNRQWREFGAANGLRAGAADAGANYREAIEHALAGGAMPAEHANLLLDLFVGRVSEARFSYPCHAPSGERRWFELVASATSLDGRRYVVIEHVNVTALMAELEHRRAEAFILSSIDDAVVATTPELRITEVNEAFVRIYGIPRENAIDRVFTDVIPSVCEDGRETALASLLQHTGTFAGRCKHQARSGDWLAVDVRVAPLLDADGHRSGFVLVNRDVTRIERAERAVIEGERMRQLGLFAARVAHDFNNVLVASTLAVGVVRAEHPAVGADLEEVERACEHGAKLVRELLQFSSGRESSPQATDVAARTRHAVSTFGRILGKNVRVHVESPSDVHLALIDPTRFEQCIVNLLTNARDAMQPDGGVIRVVIALQGDEITIRVVDTGPGISQEMISRITEPFFTTKSEGKGTGLGLSTVSSIVSDAGGSLEISSEIGVGTTMTLRLPVLKEA